MNDAGEVWMLVHQAAPLAGHDPFSPGEKSEATAVSRAERDQVRAKLVLLPVRQVRNEPAKALERVDRPDILNFNVGYQGPFIGAEIAGDDFEAVAAAQLAHQMPNAGRWLEDRPGDLDLGK